jgi:glutathione S-transferase
VITLYSAQACPYALRTRLALHEKALAFEHVEIDLKNESPEFLSVSRYGKVPALIDGDVEISERRISQRPAYVATGGLNEPWS